MTMPAMAPLDIPFDSLALAAAAVEELRTVEETDLMPGAVDEGLAVVVITLALLLSSLRVGRAGSLSSVLDGAGVVEDSVSSALSSVEDSGALADDVTAALVGVGAGDFDVT